MANLYLRSTDGNNADNGTTWALAKATFAGVDAIDAAGDNIYVSQSHTESGVGATNAWAGTVANPTKIHAGDDTNAPPTSSFSGVSFTTTNTTFSWNGNVYTYGIDFKFTSASSFAANFNNGSSANQIYVACSFQLGTGSTATALFGPTTGSVGGFTQLKGCNFKFGATGQAVAISKTLFIDGGSTLAGSTSPTNYFDIGNGARNCALEVTGHDFSNCGTGFNLCKTTDAGGRALFRFCKLPASWSGSLITQANRLPGFRAEMQYCDSASTNYRRWVADYFGDITTETVIVHSGGASDGTTPISWKMVSTSDAEYPLNTLVSPEIEDWVDTTGSVNVAIEIVTDNVTLKDDECWIEVIFLADSGTPRANVQNDSKTSMLATGANQTTSTETWTTTGLGTPVKQKVSLSVTTQKKGPIVARVVLAKASTTVYIDPKLTLT